MPAGENTVLATIIARLSPHPVDEALPASGLPVGSHQCARKSAQRQSWPFPHHEDSQSYTHPKSENIPIQQEFNTNKVNYTFFSLMYACEAANTPVITGTMAAFSDLRP